MTKTLSNGIKAGDDAYVYIGHPVSGDAAGRYYKCHILEIADCRPLDGYTGNVLLELREGENAGQKMGVSGYTLKAEGEKLDDGQIWMMEIMKRLVHMTPSPRDENGKLICLIRDNEGRIMEWPEGVDIRELDNWLERNKHGRG